MKKLLWFFIAFSFFAATSQTANAQMNFAVGTKYFKWRDESRIDKHYGENEFREVHIQVWYPIEKTKTNLKRADYFPEIEKAKSVLTNWSEEDLRLVKSVNTNSFVGAEISEKSDKYPVLIFSPSLGGHTSFYSFYAERLANAGYVVVGVNHKFESNYIINKDGEVIVQNHKFHDDLKELKIPEEITGDEYREKKGERHRIIGKDLIFVLNQLEEKNASDFSNRLDLNKVGVWGHSIGGAASIDAAKMDKRFKAVLNFDGTPSGWALREGLDQPFMYIEDLTDLSHSGYKMQFDRREAFCQKVSSDCYRVLIGNANHNSFVDINYYEAIDEKQKSASLKIIETSLKYMTDFFDKHLRNNNVEIKNHESKDLKVITKLQTPQIDLLTSFEPSPAFPYGRFNPEVPSETAQFAFMIGEFDCVDEIINPQDGKWVKFPAIWNAKYFLNGHGIQDQYWSPRFSTSNIRIFDEKEKKWKVTFFRMPGYNSGVWSGVREGENLLMRQGDDKKGTRLTFSSITKDGFEWVGESMADGKANAFWKSSCKRRR